jgi:hypothetical protein
MEYSMEPGAILRMRSFEDYSIDGNSQFGYKAPGWPARKKDRRVFVALLLGDEALDRAGDSGEERMQEIVFALNKIGFVSIDQLIAAGGDPKKLGYEGDVINAGIELKSSSRF